MANLGMTFDSTQVDTTNQFDAMPAGQYLVMVSDSEIKQTKSGTGQYLSLTLEVQEPEQFRGRKLFDNLNLWNSNQTAVEIAQRQLAQLVQGCGLSAIGDSEELHFKSAIAIVKIEKSDQYGDRNTIKGYKAAGGGHAQQQAQRPAPAQQPAPQQQAAAPRAPWAS